MPIINIDDYKPPFWLPDSQSQTIFPSIFRKVEGIDYVRERIKTHDGDFLDIDKAPSAPRGRTFDSKFFNPVMKSASRVPLLGAEGALPSQIILSHGLEGDTSRQYITGMVKNFNAHGFDCLAWNFRSCSGEINQTKRFYHSGATDDLETIVKYSLSKGYNKIYLVGFSLGGNLTLKYLGEKGQNLYPEIQKAITFSVPLHLSSSSKKIGWLYTKRFNKSLIKKILEKSQRFPEFNIDTSNIAKIKTLKDFDDRYTSQLHGFIDAEDYYERNSSLYFLDKINIPTLIINAKNDPFLSKECFPFEQIKHLEKVYFQTPKMGGHCGFYPDDYRGVLWSERRALEWFFNLSLDSMTLIP
jgi:predicted alpha/beta-fold hydrolase